MLKCKSALKRIAFILLFVLAACFVCISAVFGKADQAFLSVTAKDFSVTSTSARGSYYYITLVYNGDALPQSDYGTYQNANVILSTDDEDTLKLAALSGGGTNTSITLKISNAEYTASAPQVITIPAKTEFLSPSGYVGAYVGIRFDEAFSLYKSGDSWTTEKPVQSYSVMLNPDNVAVAWSEIERCLIATVNVPYATESAVEYAGSPVITADYYTGLPFVRHQAGEEKIEIVLPDSNDLQTAETFVSINISGCMLESERLAVKLTLNGSITFHKYTDGTWSTERYICVKESVEDTQIERKVLCYESYVFTEPQSIENKLFIGWEANGRLYGAGELYELSEHPSPIFEISAAYLSYALIQGASVRLDTALSSSGIRFGATLGKTESEAYGEYLLGVGIIVMPSNLLGAKPFIWQNYNGAGEAKNYYALKEAVTFINGDFHLYASIVRVLERNYNRSFSARAYALVRQGENSVYVWDSHIQTSSINEVAEKAYQDDLPDWQKKILKTYLNSVLSISCDGANATLDSEIGNEITLLAFERSDTIVTVTIKTDKETLPCLTYNGERIKTFTYVYADGEATVTFEVTE